MRGEGGQGSVGGERGHDEGPWNIVSSQCVLFTSLGQRLVAGCR